MKSALRRAPIAHRDRLNRATNLQHVISALLGNLPGRQVQKFVWSVLRARSPDPVPYHAQSATPARSQETQHLHAILVSKGATRCPGRPRVSLAKRANFQIRRDHPPVQTASLAMPKEKMELRRATLAPGDRMRVPPA